MPPTPVISKAPGKANPAAIQPFQDEIAWWGGSAGKRVVGQWCGGPHCIFFIIIDFADLPSPMPNKPPCPLTASVQTVLILSSLSSLSLFAAMQQIFLAPCSMNVPHPDHLEHQCSIHWILDLEGQEWADLFCFLWSFGFPKVPPPKIAKSPQLPVFIPSGKKVMGWIFGHVHGWIFGHVHLSRIDLLALMTQD